MGGTEDTGDIGTEAIGDVEDGALGTEGTWRMPGSTGGTLSLSPDLSDASVLGHTDEWREGMEGAALTCLGDGNPPPTYNWTR